MSVLTITTTSPSVLGVRSPSLAPFHDYLEAHNVHVVFPQSCSTASSYTSSCFSPTDSDSDYGHDLHSQPSPPLGNVYSSVGDAGAPHLQHDSNDGDTELNDPQPTHDHDGFCETSSEDEVFRDETAESSHKGECCMNIDDVHHPDAHSSTPFSPRPSCCNLAGGGDAAPSAAVRAVGSCACLLQDSDGCPAGLVDTAHPQQSSTEIL